MAAAVAGTADAIREGGLVVVPTDTVYGLACRADCEAAVGRLYAAKGRDTEKALPVLLADLSELSQVCRDCDEAVLRVARAFWPGALTLVVRKTVLVPDLVTGGKQSVAVRVPDCKITRRVLRQAGVVVAVTSANLSGAPPAVAVAELPPALLEQVDLILDTGTCPGGRASTLLDLTQEPPRILRSGPITRDQLSGVLQRPLADI